MTTCSSGELVFVSIFQASYSKSSKNHDVGNMSYSFLANFLQIKFSEALKTFDKTPGKFRFKKNIRSHQLSQWIFTTTFFHMDVSENNGTPKSSILAGFCFINHPFWGIPIVGNTQIHLGLPLNLQLQVAFDWGNFYARRHALLPEDLEDAVLLRILAYLRYS